MMFARLFARLFARSARVHELAKKHPLVAKALGEKPRSPLWPTIEHAHLKKSPSCKACGGLIKLNVHHIKPFHLFPTLELVDSNLITLCMSTQKCHLLIGHGDNFTCYNPNVAADAQRCLIHPSGFPAFAADAKRNRKSQ